MCFGNTIAQNYSSQEKTVFKLAGYDINLVCGQAAYLNLRPYFKFKD